MFMSETIRESKLELKETRASGSDQSGFEFLDENSKSALINKVQEETSSLKQGQNIFLAERSKQRDLLNSDKATLQNQIGRYGLVSIKSTAYLPQGIFDSLKHNLENPLDAASTLGMGAGMALVLKTVLPEGGAAGKIAAGALGIYFTYQAAEPVFDAYKKAGSANSMDELDKAAKQIAGAAGTFVVDSLIAAGGYKIGARAADRMLSARFMDGFADAKASVYESVARQYRGLSESGLKSREPQINSSTDLNLPPAGKESSLAKNSLSGGDFKSFLRPAAKMELSFLLKSKASDLKVQRTLSRISQGRQAALSQSEFLKEFAPSQTAEKALFHFARQNGLKIESYNHASGQARISGDAAGFSQALATKFGVFESANKISYLAATEPYKPPPELSKHLSSVIGLDNKAKMKSHAVELPASKDASVSSLYGGQYEASGRKAYLPNEIADAYNFPKEGMGKGQSVAIIQLGGGFDPVDNARYYRKHGFAEPEIQLIEVSGAKSKPGHAWDSEVMLDSQVIGVVAPEARQNLIFAPNSEKGFIDAVLRAGFPEKGESKNTAVSISWGLNEESWSKEGLKGMHESFKKLALQGIHIFASAGDDGARDRSTSGRLQAHYPASDPHVTANGGTRLVLNESGKRFEERVWNNGGANDAGGGGISEIFALPEYQKSLAIPTHAQTGKPGRGLPDISGNADPKTGYRIQVHGQETVMGGTSAVAPLHAALMLRINSALEKPFQAPLNPWLYKRGLEGGIFNDIIIGDNNGYKAGPGWDAASGLGSIDGSAMLALLKKQPH